MPDRPRGNKSITTLRGGFITPSSESLALRGLEDLAALSRADDSLRSELGSLHPSALNGDPSAFVDLLSVHADLVNQTDTYGLTPLHYAAYGCRAEAIRQLLGAGADVDATDSWGNTPLFYAAKEGGAHCVRFLIGAGAQPNTKNLDDESPLERSVSCRKVQMPQDLYEMDPEPFTQPMLFAPFYERVWRGGDASVVLELVNGGAHLSAEEQVFLDHCREVVSRPDWSWLREAPTCDAEKPLPEETRFRGTAIPDERRRWDVFPRHLLHHAAHIGYVGAMAFLMIEGGASAGLPAEKIFNGGPTPLHIAGTTGAMLLLIKAGAEVDARTEKGFTPFLALWFDNRRIDGYTICTDKEKPFSSDPNAWRIFLPKQPPEELGQLLVDQGADPSARTYDPENATPFHHWWGLNERNAREVLHWLLQFGFDPDPQSEEEEPIAIMLAEGQEYELLEFVIAYGGDPEVRSKEGLTPMLVSQLDGWTATHMVELLEKWGVKPHSPEELAARKANPRQG